MSLQVWLPLNGNLNNQGLSVVTSTGGTINNTGILGKCYACSSSSYITIQNPVTDKYDFSLSFWMKVPATLSSVGAWNTMLSFRALNTNDNSTEASVGINWASYNNIKIYDDANHQNIWMAPGNQFNYDKWCHYTITHTGNDSSTTIKVYTDGILRGTFNNSHRLVLRSGNILLGSGINPSYGPIYFNDFRLYDHYLSAKEVKEISKGLICHYKLDNDGFGGENLILESHRVTSGGDASGITSTYMDDGSLKIVSTSGNSNYRSCGFSKDSNSNVGSKLSVGDTYTISLDVKVEEGSSLPTLFINGGNGYKSLHPVNGKITTNNWFRAYYTSTWSEPGTSYGNISLHLGFSSAIGTFYFKNFKLEKGSKPTQWCPSPLDDSTLGLDSTTESDCSGYKNNGIKVGNVLSAESGGRYDTSTYCNSTNIGTSTPTGAAFIKCTLVNPIVNATALTINWWGNIEDYSYQNSGILSLSNDSSYPTDYLTSALAQYDSMFRFNLIDGNDSSIDSLALIETGNWHMYTLVFNNGIVQGYRDGMLVTSNSKSGTLAQFAYVYMGINVAGGAHRQTKSKWSDFRIYSTALSASDVKELYSTSASVDKNGNMYAYEFKEE